ncbi:Uncharacterized protein APZ42_014971 [Daphnia magna]|uniref:Uncharacterized protein n=1 Tax=Daphnia magna TaxID=35525 RepID=A0A162P1J6_9CRUS|nr:Uncharacterized protein APZ42_014971 [Daphnia magna]
MEHSSLLSPSFFFLVVEWSIFLLPFHVVVELISLLVEKWSLQFFFFLLESFPDDTPTQFPYFFPPFSAGLGV